MKPAALPSQPTEWRSLYYCFEGWDENEPTETTGVVMTCAKCASDMLKDFDAELAIHFPGREGLEKAHVFVFPKLMACLNCGHVEFVLRKEEIEQLNDGAFAAR